MVVSTASSSKNISVLIDVMNIELQFEELPCMWCIPNWTTDQLICIKTEINAMICKSLKVTRLLFRHLVLRYHLLWLWNQINRLELYNDYNSSFDIRLKKYLIPVHLIREIRRQGDPIHKFQSQLLLVNIWKCCVLNFSKIAS